MIHLANNQSCLSINTKEREKKNSHNVRYIYLCWMMTGEILQLTINTYPIQTHIKGG